jgi:arylsulfatase A-like enzyme
MRIPGIKRRDFLKRTVAGAMAAAWAPLLRHALAETTSPGAPNIVYILADDLGYGDLACQNPESKIPTPNLDRLAKEGIRFTDAHSPSAAGMPTRYGLLTGRYPWRSQLKRGVQQCWNEPIIESDRLTVGKLLKQRGYDTACIGKWHLGMNWPTTDGKPPVCVGRTRTADGRTNVDFTKSIANGPTTRGFDYYFGVDATHIPPYCFIENERTVGIPAEPKKGMPGCPGPMLEGWRLDGILPALMNKTLEYIDVKRGRARNDVFRQTTGKPFFLYVPLTAPRTPIAPAEEFKGKSRAGAYGDFVYEVDHVVGRVLQALEPNGFDENTIVIVTSDNGSPGCDGTDMSGAWNSVLKYGHNPSRPWRGVKTDIWEGGHRVPFLARWPGRIPMATISDETICHVDLLATVAAIVSEKLPDSTGEDSYNVLPALLGEKRDRPIREATVHCSDGDLFAIRQGKWKLITGLGSGGWSQPSFTKPEPGGPEGQLYDLHADPGEMNNLWLEYPKVVTALTTLLEKYRLDGRSR